MKVLPNVPAASIVTSIIGIVGLVTQGVSAGAVHDERDVAEPGRHPIGGRDVPRFDVRDALAAPTPTPVGILGSEGGYERNQGEAGSDQGRKPTSIPPDPPGKPTNIPPHPTGKPTSGTTVTTPTTTTDVRPT
jgi:hypothetical protein